MGQTSSFSMISLPIARPPWPGQGRKLESLCRKAIHDFHLLENVQQIGIALSGGKDSLTLLYLLHAINGRGVPPFLLHAFHVEGEYSCGSSVHARFLQSICQELSVPLTICTSKQTRESLECYSCSRERRKLIFDAAKEKGITTIAFGHHRDDSIQTLLMNLLHKAEFCANLPKIFLYHYGVTIIRPLLYTSEEQIRQFAQAHGFLRITCQCPVGQNSMRKQTEQILQTLTETFPRARENLFLSSLQYGSDKAAHKP